jgi:dTMP kinase
MKKIWKKFITFEGPECAGKTTQIAMLKTFLQKQKEKVIITREPGGTPIGEHLRDIVKYHQDSVMTDKTELLLFAASRAQLVSELILPALKANSYVICDRFIDSTVAYQGFARNLDIKFINQLNSYVIENCIPEFTFLLDLNVNESIKRANLRNQNRRNEDRIEAESINFHKTVRNGFLKLAELNSQRIKIIDATDSETNIHHIILAHLGLL